MAAPALSSEDFPGPLEAVERPFPEEAIRHAGPTRAGTHQTHPWECGPKSSLLWTQIHNRCGDILQSGYQDPPTGRRVNPHETMNQRKKP
jgi:hypothetical protein